MSAPAKPSAEQINSKSELVAYIASGNKPKSAWRIGTEHEKFCFDTKTLRPIPYGGDNGVRAILEGMQHFGWNPVFEGENLIALTDPSGANITLEPGGQLELSGAPLENIHQTCEETYAHLRQVKRVAAPLNVGFLGVGHQPKWTRNDTPWMPKGRYKIMREYMPKRGNLGLDMMLRTCTVQVNLDFSSEADMAKKFRVSLALQPLATALFATSPFKDGKPSGLLSLRSHIWTDTDPDRCGMLPFVFEDDFGFERYVDYALDVPMYFVYRDGTYLDASGQSFRDFMAGKLPALPGQLPTMGDWADHLTTAFPEVRLKKYLEMRGADGGPWRRLCALPAFWVGLLYDDAALDAAWDVVKDWTIAEREQLRSDVPRLGLDAQVAGRRLQDIAKDILAIARKGLNARGLTNHNGQDESIFLDVLDEIAASGKTASQEMLEAYATRWNQSVDPIFSEYAY